MDFASYKTLAFERRERVLQIAFDRPDKHNALDLEAHEELARVFTDAAHDKGSDVIILTGSGRAFSAGGDFEGMQRVQSEPSLFNKVATEAKQIVFSLLDLEKPIIAKVNGHAVGLGATLALLCDVVFLSEAAKIGDPHVKVGLVAGDGGAIIWPQLVGYARAKEYLMTGELLVASEAERIGLVNHVVKPEEIDRRVDEFADRLASGALFAIRASKVAANIALKQIAHAVMDVSIAYESVSARTEDHREAVAALLEKRSPKFLGR